MFSPLFRAVVLIQNLARNPSRHRRPEVRTTRVDTEQWPNGCPTSRSPASKEIMSASIWTTVLLFFLSIDGIGAFDLISRGAMLEGLRSVDGGSSALPFVLQFHGNPSSHLWTDDSGVTHGIWQGEGGEQGDPMMPMLYALGQHQALRSVQSHFGAAESLFAFHDYIYTVSQPERVGDIHNLLRDELWHHSRIHADKTQIWNRGGFEPPGHAALLDVARMADPREVSASSAPHWVLMNSSGCNSSRPSIPTGCCSTVFRLCRICSPRGSSSCSVQIPGRPTISVFVALRSRTSLLANMMPRFGSVWLPFLAMTHPFQCGRWGVCLCTWGA